MPSPAQRSTLKRIALLAALLSTLAAVSLGVLVLRWKRDIARELDAIVASGAPLTAADIEAPAATASPGWEGVERDDPVWDLGIMDPVALAALLERPDDELAPFPRDLLEDLNALYGRTAGAGRSVDDLWLGDRPLIALGSPPAPPPAGRLLIARIEHAAAGELLERAMHACAGGQFDGRAWIDDWLAGDDLIAVPDSVVAVIEAQRALGRSAKLAAIDGDADGALAALRQGFCAARAYERAPGLIHGLTWMLQVTMATDALLAVASELPEVDLTEFEGDLAGLDAQAALHRVMQEERALGMGAFERGLHPSGVDWWTSPLTSLGLWLFESNDQRVFLTTFAGALAASSEPGFSGRAAMGEATLALHDEAFALRSQFLFPAVHSAFDSAAAVHATATLAAAVLMGRREGTAAARSWIESQLDPFSGAPYRTETLAGGGIRAWSIGPDANLDTGDEIAAHLPGC